MENKRSNSVMTAEVSGSTITWKFVDGGMLEFDVASMLESPRDFTKLPVIAQRALIHGVKQKVGDAGAMSRDPVTGASANVATKRDAMRDVVENLKIGEWASEREPILLRALCALKPGKTSEQIEKWMAAQTPKFLRGLRNTPEVAAMIEKLRPARKPSEEINLDDLDAEIDAIE